MNKEQLFEHVTLFRDKANKGKLVVFVGSGVSRNVEGMPSWYKLVKSMAETIDYSKCDFCDLKTDDCSETCLFKEEYTVDEFLKIPQFVYNKDKALYANVLTKNIKQLKIKAPLSKAIFDINPSHIITTNYDNLLETSDSELQDQFDVIVHDEDLLNSSKSKYIIKMHGDIADLDTIVLKEQDYLDYSQNHVLIELFVKALLTDHTFMFLGYSLNDYNIKLIISWINYIRTQNEDVIENKKIGYIILDDEIDETQISYFENNNIGVININNIPTVNNIPESIKHEKGKRLYSFLSAVSSQNLCDELFEEKTLESSLILLSDYRYVNYMTVLKWLGISYYDKKDYCLKLFKLKDFEKIVSILTNDLYSIKLTRILNNIGIKQIICDEDISNVKEFLVSKQDNVLFEDEQFKAYISNSYLALDRFVNSSFKDNIKKCFYRSILYGYNGILDTYNEIDAINLNTENRINYLHNLAFLKAMSEYTFDPSKVKNYIEGIPSLMEREIYKPYLNIYEGNHSALNKMEASYSKLKNRISDNNTIYIGGTKIDEIYKIKNYVIEYYCFCFANHLFFNGSSEMKTYFKPYISAIICANSEKAKESSNFEDVVFENKKYFIEPIDFDIITKFISTKDLYNLIKENKITELNTSEEVVDHLVNSFYNICQFITNKHCLGYYNSIALLLSNLGLILTKVNTTKSNKKIIQKSLNVLFNDSYFVNKFFSINLYDFRTHTIIFAELLSRYPVNPNKKIVKSIIEAKDFFHYSCNVNFSSMKKIVDAFLNYKDLYSVQNDLKSIIDSLDSLNKKVIAIRLFKEDIKRIKIKNEYKEYLSANFNHLDKGAIYDFVFSNWITPTKTDIDTLLENTLALYKKSNNGIRTIPDPLEMNLECIYILFMEGYIKDIGKLSIMFDSYPILQFLNNPNEFDYSIVDFSYYMWKNFVYRDNYRELFIEHKDDIIPNIKAKIQKDEASELEKKILYGFLLDKSEILN